MIKYIFLLILFFTMLADSWLDLLNIKYGRRKSGSVPEALKGLISTETSLKSFRYTEEKQIFALIKKTVTSIVLIAVLTADILPWLSSILVQSDSYLYSVLFLLTLSVLSWLLQLPFDLYFNFVIEKKYEFNKMTIKIFVTDLIKSALLSLIMIVPLMLVFFIFLEKTGTFWWLYAYSAFFTFQLVLSFLYPRVIAPLFNKFSGLEEGDLKEALENLAERCGFTIKGLFVMDGSKRSSHGNAYMTGFGKNKRIVLFDTLINSMEIKECEAVLAHEIGHNKKGHIIKNIIWIALISALAFYFAGILSGWNNLFISFGFEGGVNRHALILFFSLLLEPAGFLLTPLLSSMTRKMEYEADQFACEACGSPEALTTALIKLGKDNLSNLNPHPLYSFFHYSHPTLAERCRAMGNLTVKE